MIVSLADMKSYLGISGTTHDAFLTEQLILVQSTVENYCRRKFEQANYSQTWYPDDNSRSRMLTTFMFPVISVTSIVEDGVTTSSSLYRIHKPTGIITKNRGEIFHAVSETTVVAYSAGYAPADMPPEIVSVIKSIVQERYNKNSAGADLNFGSDVQRISIPGAISIDFDYTLQNNERSSTFGVILGNYVNVLDFFRSDRAILPSDKLEYL